MLRLPFLRASPGVLRRFAVFLASSAFAASASSYHFAIIAPLQQHRLPNPEGR
ncbi:DUF1010 domain-containing protein [Acidovorax sp.]|uniref:DUF1010 domain-containing protein n=1 Tax=Acidovorax sp. TaxID=1872122 RepID=UPI00344F0C41